MLKDILYLLYIIKNTKFFLNGKFSSTNQRRFIVSVYPIIMFYYDASMILSDHHDHEYCNCAKVIKTRYFCGHLHN